jgi:hypothetical protein
MKKLIFIILSISIIFSIDLPLERTAILLEKGQKEIGVFHPYRLGKSNDIEYSIHPILGFIIPNFKMKGTLLSAKNSTNSYSLQFTYPTPLLKLVQKEGIGGLITPNTNEVSIPHLLVSRLKILSTRVIKENHLFTMSAGMEFAIGLGEIDSRITIDLPYFFPRMNMYNSDFALITGLHFTGKIWKNIGYDSGGEFKYTVGSKHNISFEHGDYMFWQFKPNMKVLLGYNLYFAEYPFGNQWDLIPTLDLRYSW